jgi:hypothetical protein
MQAMMLAAGDFEPKPEGHWALNFLVLDGIPLAPEGEPIEPKSILRLSGFSPIGFAV